MTARERNLSIIVGSIVLVLLNYFLIQFFLKNQRRLREEFASKTAELSAQRLVLADKDLWETRSAWVASKQPKLTNEARAGSDLLDQVKEVAKTDTVLLEGQAIGTPEKRTQCVAVSVNFETKSTWEALCRFLRDMQGLEQFIVFESANLQVDAADKTQMHGRFRVAKWYAPR